MSNSHIFGDTYNLKNKELKNRYDRTLAFLKESVPPPAKILDLGVANLFSEMMETNGYDIKNTKKGIDLDLDTEVVKNTEFDVVTAFQIFEHLVAPFNVLKAIEAPNLVASVPLNLWFSNAYWNEKDKWDRHYHEFEPRQFNMVLEKAGWKIKDSRKWASHPPNKIGFRPLLRRFTPRYYIVHCVRV